MSRPFSPARLRGQRIWPVQSFKTKAAEVWADGALVVTDANGELTECGADPASIRGVALAAAFAGPGNELSFSSQVVNVTGTIDECSVALADGGTIFAGEMYSGTTLVTPTQTMIGESYGVAVLSDGTWVIDQTETSATRLTITDIDVDLKLCFFKFLTANVQI